MRNNHLDNRQRRPRTRLKVKLILLALVCLALLVMVLIFKSKSSQTAPTESEVPQAMQGGAFSETESTRIKNTDPNKLSDNYNPFDEPSSLAESIFQKNIDQYSDQEKILVEREPAAVEFLVRLHDKDYVASKTVNYQDKLIQGKLPHYVQWDQRWGFSQYLGEAFGFTGCGPTCLSMVYTGLTGKTDYPPDKMGQFASENHHVVQGVGSAWTLMEEGARDLSLHSEKIEINRESFNKALDQGKLLILSVKPGDFTRVGHFIVVWSHDNGFYHILDPFNVRLSQKSWSFDALAWQTAAAWAFSKD